MLESLAGLVRALSPPRAVWLMVPAALVDRELAALAPQLGKGDTIIDGSNSCYHDDIRRAGELKATTCNYLDEGPWRTFGLERGYCLMIGPGAGRRASEPCSGLLRDRCRAATRPNSSTGAANRSSTDRPRRTLRRWCATGTSTADRGVRGRLEHRLHHADAVLHPQVTPTTPLRQRTFQCQLKYREDGGLWHGRRDGSRSSTPHPALQEDPDLSGFSGRVSDSGQGHSTLPAR